MSNSSGAPKGYSVPRHELKEAAKRCQHCQSTDHWSFECPDKKSAKKTNRSGPKLSPSLLLKYGIQKKKILFEPEKSESEQFNVDMKELEAQAREMEKLAQKQATSESLPTAPRVKADPDSASVKKELPSDDDADSEERDATAP